MRNINLDVKEEKLIITIDLNNKGITSASGKSIVIASTEGNIPIPNKPEIKLGLNVYTKM
jgi:hypothetical protein